jgi:uncharacterized membrane protein
LWLVVLFAVWGLLLGWAYRRLTTLVESNETARAAA